MQQAKRKKKRPSGLWQWHLWFGLVATVPLLLAAVSGVLLLYQKELVRLVVTPGAHMESDRDSHADAQTLQTLVQEYASGAMINIKAPSRVEPYWTIREDHSLTLLNTESLEPYTRHNWLLDAFAVVRELHVHLLTSVVGEWLLLISGLAALFLCVSGIILWWPGRKAFRWQWITPNPVRRSHYLHYHRHLGALISPVLLVVLLTGAVMLWQKRVQPLLPPQPVSTFSTAPKDVLPLTIAEAMSLVQQIYPNARPTYIRAWADGDGRQLRVRFRLADEWHLNGRTTVWVNLDSGIVSGTARSDKVGEARKLVNQLYPLHSGYGMDFIYRTLVLLSGVGFCWVLWTGFMHYIKRQLSRKRRHSNTPSKPHPF